MSRPAVVFLGGNGHCAARLLPARRHLEATGAAFDLLDVEYPGFEGRPAAPSFEAFLDKVSARMTTLDDGNCLFYATGIGGLLALSLRARGGEPQRPLLLQAPVLWGLERRFMPRLLRRLPARALLGWLFRKRAFQRHFARRHFLRSPDAAELLAFFDGYARCRALADFFAWLRPALLRQLEADFRRHPERLAGVKVWWGGRDGVVGVAELGATETALAVKWPLRVFPSWGHYPMLDSPAEWTAALAEELRGARAS
jgi:pimeloyl-ACP methyl ester carboxylesterase